MTQDQALRHATAAARKCAEPYVLRSDAHGAHWFYERASWVLANPAIAVGVRLVVMPTGEVRLLKRDGDSR